MAHSEDWSETCDSFVIAGDTQRPDRPGVSPEFPVHFATRQRSHRGRVDDITIQIVVKGDIDFSP